MSFKTLVRLCLALSFLAVSAHAQHASVTDITYGNGQAVSESSGNGAPSSACTSLKRYTQLDAAPGANIWHRAVLAGSAYYTTTSQLTTMLSSGTQCH